MRAREAVESDFFATYKDGDDSLNNIKPLPLHSPVSKYILFCNVHVQEMVSLCFWSEKAKGLKLMSNSSGRLPCGVGSVRNSWAYAVQREGTTGQCQMYLGT